MNALERRRKINEILHMSREPVSASALAASFSVSRQIVVGDIAILRAAGADITATPRGYIIKSQENGEIHTIACIHTSDLMEDELNAMVDNGCTVVNVIVEHPVYGEMTGELALKSRYDVSQFMERVRAEGASPLSSLTGGVHLHTLKCPDADAFRRVTEKLGELGVLFTENGD